MSKCITLWRCFPEGWDSKKALELWLNEAFVPIKATARLYVPETHLQAWFTGIPLPSERRNDKVSRITLKKNKNERTSGKFFRLQREVAKAFRGSLLGTYEAAGVYPENSRPGMSFT